MKFNLSGYLPEVPDERDYAFMLTPASYILPEEVIYRSQMTKVENQGARGSCVGMSGSAICEFWNWKQTGLPIDLSAEWAYQKAKLYDEFPGSDYSGTTLRGVCKALKAEGICLEVLYPYSQTDPAPLPSEQAIKDAETRKIVAYKNLALIPVLMVEVIKRGIHEFGPVIIGVYVYENWSDIGKDGIVPMPKGRMLGGHALAAVGYNKDYVICKNSWGEGFGDSGYLLIPLEYIRKFTNSAWAIDRLI